MNELKTKISDKNLTPFQRLILIMEILRSPEGCAWDRKQTHTSLLPYLIEEAYEVVEAVESADSDHIKEELGDLLCQVVFHCQIAKEAGRFDIDGSINSIADKLVHRHPHVFEENADLTPDQVRDQWEKIKVEKGEKKSVLDGLPDSMPALTMAFRIGEKAAGVGFDWNRTDQVMAKLEEELEEIKAEIANNDKERLAEEIGDLLFATASLARKSDIDPERALKNGLRKFRQRFERLEKEVRRDGKSFDDFTLDQLEEVWGQIKSDDQ